MGESIKKVYTKLAKWLPYCLNTNRVATIINGQRSPTVSVTRRRWRMKLFIALLVIAPFVARDVVAQVDPAGAAGAPAAPGGDGADGVAAGEAVSGPELPGAIELPIPSFSCVCTTEDARVCGTDGQTYPNDCILGCVSIDNVVNGRPPINVKGKGECRRWYCSCPNYYQPVCGSDGNTYRNNCFLQCENNRRAFYGLPLIRRRYFGRCCPLINCRCPDTVIPVCGTDGKTYRNMCYLVCASKLNQLEGRPPIYVQSTGPCKNENCGCPDDYQPLCANYIKSFGNYCKFNCENRRRFALGLAPLAITAIGRPCY